MKTQEIVILVIIVIAILVALYNFRPIEESTSIVIIPPEDDDSPTHFPEVITNPEQFVAPKIPFSYGYVDGLTMLGEVWSYHNNQSGYLLSKPLTKNITSLTVRNVHFISYVGVEFAFNQIQIMSFPDLRLCQEVNVFQNSLTTLSLPKLEQCLTGFNIFNISTETLDFPKLTFTGNFYMEQMSQLTTLLFPKLISVTNELFIFDAALLTSIDLPSLESSGDIIIGDCTTLTTILFPNLMIAGNYGEFLNNALNQETVDHILEIYASLDGTNGKSLFDGDLLLQGGTNATPSATGLISKGIIQGRGGTVTHN